MKVKTHLKAGQVVGDNTVSQTNTSSVTVSQSNNSSIISGGE
jgi:hypothetical protein